MGFVISVLGRGRPGVRDLQPEGYSFYHWALFPVFGGSEISEGGPAPLKFLAGVVLLTGWVVFLQATRRSLGLVGVVLAAAFCAGLIWLMIEWELFSASNLRTMTHLVLIIISAVLAVGMSWSHIHRRLSGQVDTDEVN
ncbi:MAG: DUF6524 family protein [Chromatiales bacterium]